MADSKLQSVQTAAPHAK